MIEDSEPAAERSSDAAAITQALELELIRQRAHREKAKARRRAWRAVSLLFLLLVLLGALFACFYFLPGATRAHSPGTTSPAAENGR